MIFGRILGWVCLLVALVMVSAEAVLALGAEPHQGLATKEIWILFAGQAFDPARTVPMLREVLTTLMDWPAWAAFGLAGAALCLVFRPHARRRSIAPPRRMRLHGSLR